MFANLYVKLNRKYLIYDKVTRETMLDIIDKMCEVADFYFETYCDDNEKDRKIYENNLLCYRIRNNKTHNEPTTINTILSILSGINFFMKEFRKDSQKVFTDSVFYNSVGLCSTFSNFTIKKVPEAEARFYKSLNIPDGQPFSPKYWFFNDGTLTKTINDFLNLIII